MVTTPEQVAPYAMKATALRGIVAVLAADGTLEAVRAGLSPATRALVDQPPPASTWIDGNTLEELLNVVAAQQSQVAIHTLTRRALGQGLAPILRPLIESTLRVFGAQPPVILTRLGTLSKSTLRGVTFAYTPTNERSGVVEIAIPSKPVVSRALFESYRGTLEAAFSYFDFEGFVFAPEIAPEGNRASYRVRW